MCWFFLFKQKTAYEMRISDWSSDVCSSDLCLGCKRLISFNKRWRPPVVSHQIDAFFLRVAPLWCDNWKRLAPARPNPVGAAMAAMQFVGWVERSETHHPRAYGHADG